MRPYALTLACKRKFEALAKEGMIFVMYATLLNRILRNPSPNLELAMYAQKIFGIFRILEGLIEIIIPDNIVHPPRSPPDEDHQYLRYGYSAVKIFDKDDHNSTK